MKAAASPAYRDPQPSRWMMQRPRTTPADQTWARFHMRHIPAAASARLRHRDVGSVEEQLDVALACTETGGTVWYGTAVLYAVVRDRTMRCDRASTAPAHYRRRCPGRRTMPWTPNAPRLLTWSLIGDVVMRSRQRGKRQGRVRNTTIDRNVIPQAAKETDGEGGHVWR